MEDTTRSFSITGCAAKDYMSGAKKKRASRKKQEGGGLIETAASSNPSTWLSNPTTVQPPIIKVDLHPQSVQGAPIIQNAQSSQPQIPHVPQVAQVAQVTQIPQQGGVKQIRVELKKKSTTHKVKLNPKKTENPKQKHYTKKVRKITLGISSLHKRMTRAKKVQKKMSDMPIDKLKEILISKKLIKANTKAPEAILRQIAADSHLVAKKVL